jgi:hypothetical protein
MKKLIFPALILLAVSCNDSEPAPVERTDGFSKKAETPQDSLYDEVMHGHDVAMAKMGKIGRYRKELQNKIDSLSKVGGEAKSSLKASFKELESELKVAEDGMNKWMDEFEIDSAQDDIKRRIEYLSSEKLKVDDVKEKILNAVSKADSLLKK